MIGYNALEAADPVLNFKSYNAIFFNEEVEMLKVGTGHICIDLLSINLETHISDRPQGDAVVKDLLVALDVVNVKGLQKLHHLYGPTSAEKLLESEKS